MKVSISGGPSGQGGATGVSGTGECLSSKKWDSRRLHFLTFVLVEQVLVVILLEALWGN